MRITFLGTAAGEGFPDAFCACQSCEDARAEGGKSLRYHSAALVNDELLIDMGPDLMAASMRFGIALNAIPYAIQTHSHPDHMDVLTFFSRSRSCQVQRTANMRYFCSSTSRRRLGAFVGDTVEGNGITDPAVQESLHLTITTIEPWREFKFGPYRVQPVAANHGGEIEAMLFAIADERGDQIFYGTDTGSLPSDTWRRLAALGWSFDLVILDHTFGFADRAAGHMNADQFLEEIDAATAAGAVSEFTTIVATHIAHHSNPAHSELVRRGNALGYEIAYDGLTIDTSEARDRHVANVRIVPA